MSKKITGKVSRAARRKLEGLAATKFNGGIGRATVHVVRLGLDAPNQENTMDQTAQTACSVNVDEDLVTEITAFQGAKGIAKRTDATKLLIELGLSVIDAAPAA